MFKTTSFIICSSVSDYNYQQPNNKKSLRLLRFIEKTNASSERPGAEGYKKTWSKDCKRKRIQPRCKIYESQSQFRVR